VSQQLTPVAAAPAAAEVEAAPVRTPWHRGDSRVGIVLFLLPFVVLYLGFTLWPLMATVYYSFFDWDGIRPLNQFVGIDNYTKIVGDRIFWVAFGNTLLFAVANTVIKLPLALIVAVLLTRRWLLFKRFFRTVFFMPIVIPVAMAGLVFTYILNPSNGALDSFLVGSGILKQPIDLLGQSQTVMVGIVLVSVWQIFGQYMIYWMAALQSVPEDVYEAADLDGCREWQKLLYITLPMIKPVALIITLLALVNALHVFGVVVTLTEGGPGQSSYVIAYYIWNEAFRDAPFRYGYASAAALIFGVLAFIFVLGQGVIVRRAERIRQDYGI
jgi:ABC-type sugar transport system permease subunit